jgi:Bacterial Ig-like domain
MRIAMAIVLGGLMWSCKSSGSDVQCADNTNCNAATGGVCRENPGSGNQWCSYPDLQCPSGFRWSEEDVGDGVSGYCVDLSATDKTPPVVVSRTPAPDELAASPSAVLSITFSEKVDPASASTSAVQIQLDGGSPLPTKVVANGESIVITPAAPLDPKRTYKISVSTDIRDLAGNHLAEPVVWNFGTREASWKQQNLLEQEQGKTVSNLVAASSNGVIVVAWSFSPCVTSQQCTTGNEIWAAVRKNQSWLPASKIATAPYSAYAAAVGVNELGRATVLYGSRAREFGGTSLMAISYDGNAWSGPATLELLDEMNTHATGNASVVADGAGGMLAIWERSLGISVTANRFDIRAARFVQGAGWEPAQTIDVLETPASSAAAVNTGVGNASATWIQDGKLRLSKFANNSWSSPDEGPAVPSGCYSLAFYPGEITASWKSGGGAYASRYRVNTWETPKRLDVSGGPVASCAPGKDMHYLADGTAVTAWSAGNDVQQATRAPGQDWGLSFPIEPANVFASNVRLATGGTRALAVFLSSDLQSNEYNPSGGWKGAETVPVEGAVGDSVLVYDSLANNFVFIFTHSNPGEVTSVSSKVYQ